MAIITFCSKDLKETGQTLSLAAVATYMAIEHNSKVLIVSTSFNDLTLENCFWEYSKIRQTGAIKADNMPSVGLESGIEGLIKILHSNKTSNEIVKNYSRILLRERLDILLSPTAKTYQEYAEICTNYTSILQSANRYYDLIFVDLSKKMPKNEANAILQLSDIVVVNLVQRLKTINDFMKLREQDSFYQRKNVIVSIGKYDKDSKYNTKNVTRYLKEKKTVSAVPYNTLLIEAASEGTIIDIMLRIKNITDNLDENKIFINEIKAINNNITTKLQELQIRI